MFPFRTILRSKVIHQMTLMFNMHNLFWYYHFSILSLYSDAHLHNLVYYESKDISSIHSVFKFNVTFESKKELFFLKTLNISYLRNTLSIDSLTRWMVIQDNNKKCNLLWNITSHNLENILGSECNMYEM